MPNTSNILSPVTVVGNGRSGTSLLSKVFGKRPDFQYGGETVNLIHSVYYSMAASLPEKMPLDRPQAHVIEEVIRRSFLDMLPSSAEYWMHKPIGIPIIKNYFKDDDEFAVWYWDVLERVFPQAQFLTMLRHPLDVAVSSHKWWDRPFKSVLNSNMAMAKLLTHPASKISYAVCYEKLIASPKEETEKLFEHLKIPFKEESLTAFKQGVVVGTDSGDKQDELAKRKKSNFSRKAEWQEIPPHLVTPEYREAIEACWSKFGHDFGGWPELGVSKPSKKKLAKKLAKKQITA